MRKWKFRIVKHAEDEFRVEWKDASLLSFLFDSWSELTRLTTLEDAKKACIGRIQEQRKRFKPIVIEVFNP